MSPGVLPSAVWRSSSRSGDAAQRRLHSPSHPGQDDHVRFHVEPTARSAVPRDLNVSRSPNYSPRPGLQSKKILVHLSDPGPICGRSKRVRPVPMPGLRCTLLVPTNHQHHFLTTTKVQPSALTATDWCAGRPRNMTGRDWRMRPIRVRAHPQNGQPRARDPCRKFVLCKS